jgi:hypothetical protein
MSNKNIFLLILFTIFLSMSFSSHNNLIIKNWTCEANEFIKSSFVINNLDSYLNLLQKNHCSDTINIPKLTASDFIKNTVLCLYDEGQAFCHAQYFSQVIYDLPSKKYVYTHITNGVGGCRHMAIPILHFVIIPKVTEANMIKFRYLYLGSSNGKDLSKNEARKLLNGTDQNFVIINN